MLILHKINDIENESKDIEKKSEEDVFRYPMHNSFFGFFIKSHQNQQSKNTGCMYKLTNSKYCNID